MLGLQLLFVFALGWCSVVATSLSHRFAEFKAVKGVAVTSALDGTIREVGSLWGENEVAALICFRSFG